MIISHGINNFKIFQSGKSSLTISESIINTPFGIVTVEEKTFDDIKNDSFILIKMDFTVTKTLIQVKLDGIDGHSGRLYKNKYSSLSAEFLYAINIDGFLNDENGDPYYSEISPNHEIYYISVARISKFDNDEKSIYLINNKKLVIPFFTNYYGLGLGD
jgi:hypothetical protein